MFNCSAFLKFGKHPETKMADPRWSPSGSSGDPKTKKARLDKVNG